MLSDDCLNSLQDWKFNNALRAMQDGLVEATSEEQNIVTTLALLFGNCGYFDGEVSTLIAVAVHHLTPPGLGEPSNGQG